MIIKSSIGSTPFAGAGQTQTGNRCMNIIRVPRHIIVL